MYISESVCVYSKINSISCYFSVDISVYLSFAKEPYKRDDILQKRPIIPRSLLIVAIPYLSNSPSLSFSLLNTRTHCQREICIYMYL